MRDDQRAARALWRELIRAAVTAGEGELCLDDIAYVAHEFAVGLMALDFTKDQLMAFLASRLREIAVGELAVVEAGFGRAAEHGLSDIAWKAGLNRADPEFKRRAVRRVTTPPALSELERCRLRVHSLRLPVGERV